MEQNSLFVSNGYKGESFVREAEVHTAAGERIIQRMTVGRVHANDRARGVLRQIHQDAYFKLLELWGQKGWPVGQVRKNVYGTLRLSAYELVTAIFASDNARSYRRTRELLRDLQSVPIVLENIHTHQGLKDREEFTLLAEVTWSETGLLPDGRPDREGKSTVTILFSSLVTEGFLASHLKVLLGQSYDSLSEQRGRRSEIASLLYPFLDAQLAKKARYEASLDDLAIRFGLTRYSAKSRRKEKFTPAVRLLQGKLIIEGAFKLGVQLIERGDDYVLEAVREPLRS